MFRAHPEGVARQTGNGSSVFSQNDKPETVRGDGSRKSCGVKRASRPKEHK